MKTNLRSSQLFILLISCTYLLSSCKCDEEPLIRSFAFIELNPVAIGEINQSEGTILVTVPESTDVSALSPKIEVANTGCHTLSPQSNTPQDFTGKVSYQVINEKGDVNQYEVSVVFQSENQGLELAWVEKTPVPVRAGWMPAVELNNKIYVIGGGVEEVGASDKMYVYDPVTDTWDDTKASLNFARFSHTANMVNGKIYVMGGVPSATSNAMNTIEIYDPETDEWKLGSVMPLGRAAHGSCVIDKKIYLVGGELEEPTKNIINDVSVFDTGSKEWTTLTPMPTASCYLVANAVDGKIYATGGFFGYADGVSDLMLVYDPATNTWTEKTNMPIEKWGHGSCVINDTIFCLGGASTLFTPGSTNNQVYVPSEDKWISGTNMKNNRLAPAVCSFQGEIIAIGGSNSSNPWPTNTNKVEVGKPLN